MSTEDVFGRIQELANARLDSGSGVCICWSGGSCSFGSESSGTGLYTRLNRLDARQWSLCFRMMRDQMADAHIYVRVKYGPGNFGV